MNAAVFAGPTICVSEAQKIFDATFLPPAAQGDVRRLVRKGVKAIGIIDGRFHSVRSVWHKEILWALSEGVHVFGAASIGALRAAELHTFGMIGVGKVFEMFRDGELEDDDEVTVIHAPDEQKYAAMSVAMVNIRATLMAATKDGVLSRQTANALESEMKALYFPRRTYERVLNSRHLADEQRQALREWLPAGQVDQKRVDAIDMLRYMKDAEEGRVVPQRVSFSFEYCAIFADS